MNLVQVADIIAYTISWALRLKGMNSRKRNELEPVTREVLNSRFRHEAETRVTWGYKVIQGPRPALPGAP